MNSSSLISSMSGIKHQASSTCKMCRQIIVVGILNRFLTFRNDLPNGMHLIDEELLPEEVLNDGNAFQGFRHFLDSAVF